MTKQDLSYMAGFFDGEGSIQILRYQKKDNPWAKSYFLQIAIGQNDGATLDWIRENFGGGVYLVKRDDSFYWSLTNKNAYLFLKKMVSRLRYKKPQAEMAIKFYEELIIPRREKRFGEKISAEGNKRREWYYWEMRRLKKVFIKSAYNGVKKVVATTTERVDPKGM